MPLSLPATIMSQLPHRRLRGRISAASLAALSSLLVACAAYPNAAVVTKLEISGAGKYIVDGQQVELAQLASVLKSKRRGGERLVVHIVPSSDAKYEAVAAGMKQVQSVGAEVGLVGNERF